MGRYLYWNGWCTGTGDQVTTGYNVERGRESWWERGEKESGREEREGEEREREGGGGERER